eukprot:6048922-Pleurochrysis_carterae.AAC.3
MPTSRLVKEYRELRSAPADADIELELDDESDIFAWTARLQGPSGTPYANGRFELRIRCAQNYPLSPPKVSFVTPIFHPNVLFKTGEICLDILKPDSWTPAWTLQSVCRAVIALLSHPEADSPLNCDCDLRHPGLATLPRRAACAAETAACCTGTIVDLQTFETTFADYEYSLLSIRCSLIDPRKQQLSRTHAV